MNLLAVSWTWPLTIIVVAAMLSFTMLAVVTVMPRQMKHLPTAGPSPRLKEMDEKLDAIRHELADVKATLAELDRQFKSVG